MVTPIDVQQGRYRSRSPSGEDIQESQSIIAKEVVKLLTLNLQAMTEKAVMSGIQTLQREVQAQASCITEARDQISSLEDDQNQLTASNIETDKLCQTPLDWVEDLENRCRRRNLRFIGLPESYPPTRLLRLCSKLIPQTLELKHSFIVERAHRLGPPTQDRTGPRAETAKYLNYADKADFVQAYRQTRSLEVEGLKLLVFAGYSQEVSRKRRSSTQICASLYQKRAKFTLAYPSILYIQTLQGDRVSFATPMEAEY